VAPSSTPTSLTLDGRAEYYPDGDTVFVAVFLVDPELGMGFPGLVKSGHCSLLYRTTTIRRIDFDKRFGNGEGAEGDFIFQFSHPSVTTDLRIELEVEAPLPPPPQPPNQNPQPTPPGIYKKTIPVTRADNPYIPLQPTPLTGEGANDELRSQARIKELV